MKGHEIINYICRAKMPDREQIRENCIRQIATQAQGTTRLFFRLPALIAVTAIVAICFIFGNMILNPQNNNSFSVIAYALEQQANGSISLRDHDITSSGEKRYICLSNGDSYMYFGIYFELVGENIENVELIADRDNKLILAHVLTENGELVTYNHQEYYDDDGNFEGYSADFTVKSQEALGNSYRIDSIDGLPEDSILFVGKPDPDRDYSVPPNITIRAVATFKDGTTQEETFLIN